MSGQSVPAPPIVLTTDFGTSDAYVGVMKGVILGINPRATVIDLTHEIAPQNLRQGSFVLGTNHLYFPTGTIHVAVVDPGVGTDRKPIVLETPAARFVAPDNGLLSEVIKGYLATSSADSFGSGRVTLPPELQAHELTNPRYRLSKVSNTFHGRDIFSPAAAYLSLGIPCEDMGPPVRDVTYAPLPQPEVQGHILNGEVIYIDRFGNLITNIEVSALSDQRMDLRTARTQMGEREVQGISRTFHDPESTDSIQPDGLQLIVLFGSNGYLEIAETDGHASESLGVGVGTGVRLVCNP